MPGFILHLLHGKLFLEQYGKTFSEREKSQFTIGLLMPDSNKIINCTLDNSHYYGTKQNGRILKFPDLNRFPYYGLIDLPYVLGYLAHLYLDHFFFSDFFLRYVYFLDENDEKTLVKSAIKRVWLVQSNQYISVDELFSEQYLYGDYTMLNQFIVNKYNISPIDCVQVNNPIQEVDINNFESIRKSLNRYLSDSSGQTNTRVFPLEALESTIERYAYGFGQWTDGIKKGLRYLSTVGGKDDE